MLRFFRYSYGTCRDLHSFPTRRSSDLVPMLPLDAHAEDARLDQHVQVVRNGGLRYVEQLRDLSQPTVSHRSEEHTSELQSRENLVCRLLLEKKKKQRSSNSSLRT